MQEITCLHYSSNCCLFICIFALFGLMDFCSFISIVILFFQTFFFMPLDKVVQWFPNKLINYEKLIFICYLYFFYEMTAHIIFQIKHFYFSLEQKKKINSSPKQYSVNQQLNMKKFNEKCSIQITYICCRHV